MYVCIHCMYACMVIYLYMYMHMHMYLPCMLVYMYVMFIMLYTEKSTLLCNAHT